MGHLPYPNLCGGLLVLPDLVVVWIGCSSSVGLSTSDSSSVSVGVFVPSSLGVLVMFPSGFVVVDFFGRPFCFATAFFVPGANLAGWQFAQ